MSGKRYKTMHQATCRWPALLLALLLPLTAKGEALSDEALPSDAAMARLSQQVDELALWGYSGFIVIGQGEQTLARYALGLAHRGLAGEEKKTAFDESSQFPWLSLSKPLTAALLLRLEARGELHLSDRLGRFYEDAPSDHQAIQLQQLLSHQSGLAAQLQHRDFDAPPEFEPIDRRELERRIWRSEMMAEAGERFRYSNLGYNLAAAVAEKVSGKGFSELLQSQVLDPAGMDQVRLGGVGEPKEVMGYQALAPWGRFSERAWPDGEPGWNLIGAGGLMGDIHGLETLVQLLRGAEPMEDQAVRWRTSQIGPEQGPAYGLGWQLDRDAMGQRIGHDGGFGPFSTELAWWPASDTWLVLVSNSSHFRAWEVRDWLSPTLAGDAGRAWPEPPAASLPEEIQSWPEEPWVVAGPDDGCWRLSRQDDRLDIHAWGATASHALLGPTETAEEADRALIDRLRALLGESRHRPEPSDRQEAKLMQQLTEQAGERLPDQVEGIQLLGLQPAPPNNENGDWVRDVALSSETETVQLRLWQDAAGRWRELEWSPRETGLSAVMRHDGAGQLHGLLPRAGKASARWQLSPSGEIRDAKGRQLNLAPRHGLKEKNGTFDRPCGPD